MRNKTLIWESHHVENNSGTCEVRGMSEKSASPRMQKIAKKAETALQVAIEEHKRALENGVKEELRRAERKLQKAREVLDFVQKIKNESVMIKSIRMIKESYQITKMIMGTNLEENSKRSRAFDIANAVEELVNSPLTITHIFKKFKERQPFLFWRDSNREYQLKLLGDTAKYIKNLNASREEKLYILLGAYQAVANQIGKQDDKFLDDLDKNIFRLSTKIKETKEIKENFIGKPDDEVHYEVLEKGLKTFGENIKRLEDPKAGEKYNAYFKNFREQCSQESSELNRIRLPKRPWMSPNFRKL